MIRARTTVAMLSAAHQGLEWLALRRHRPEIHTVAVEPAESPVLSAGTADWHRIEGIGIGFVPPLWHPSDASEMATVSSDEAQKMARRLAVEESLFVGTSSAANVVAALRVAERLGPGATVGTMLCDSGIKYLSTEVFKRRVPPTDTASPP